MITPKCPNCGLSEYVQDAYPEKLNHWVCVECGHIWRKPRPKKPRRK